jgi:hypothetical protein
MLIRLEDAIKAIDNAPLHDDEGEAITIRGAINALERIPAFTVPEGLADRLHTGFVSEDTMDEAAAFLRSLEGK